MTLTELSFYSRKFAPFGVLALLILFIVYYLIKLLLLSVHPTTTTPLFIDPVFGGIKRPFIKETKTSGGLNYTLDTIEGKPTSATESAEVYFLPTLSTRFGYREKIYLMAKSFGFDTQVTKHKLVGKEATFKDSNQTLTINITSFNFTYKYNFEKDPKIFENVVTPDKKTSETKATNFLSEVGRYPTELTKGKTNTVLISYSPNSRQMRVVEQAGAANISEVDFYRPDPGEYPIVSPTYFNSQNYVMMVFYQSDFKIIRAQVMFHEKSETQVGTYPLKSADLAWEGLRSGQGWAIQNPQKLKDIVIKKMFLGYLDPEEYQEYLQPVYVFLGEENFVGYVPAVRDDYFIK